MKPAKTYSDLVIAIAAALLVAGCGGGGGGDPQAKPQSVDTTIPIPDTTTPQTFYTLAQGQLPGQLSYGDAQGVGRSYDLHTGIRTLLPALAQSPDKTGWAYSSGGKYVMRINGARTDATVLDIFKTEDLSKPWRTVSLPPKSTNSALSWDAQYVLTYVTQNAGDAGRLAIYDTATGRQLKIGSRMDGALRFGATAAWLPDGFYVYLVGNQLWGASPAKDDDTRLFTMDELPFNDGANQHYLSSTGGMAVSPDGSKLAFAWSEYRNFTNDAHIWVVDMDKRITGKPDGEAHRLTKVPVANSASPYLYVSPVWSPDGLYIAGVAKVEGTSIIPEFPGAEDTPLGGWAIAEVSGCLSSVFVLPSDARGVPVPEMPIDKDITLKVRTPDGKKASWLTVCGAPVMSWTP